MQNTRFLIALALTVSGAEALRAQVTRDALPSGRGTTEVTLVDPRDPGPGTLEPITITLDYGQPHLRGRTLHTDSLVPYDRPWRSGANAATKLTSGVDLVLGGVNVQKGAYFVYTLPTRAGWKLMLQRDTGQNPGAYDAANDAARIDLRLRQLPMPIESLTMWLIPSRAPGAPRGELRILWGHVELSTDWSVR